MTVCGTDDHLSVNDWRASGEGVALSGGAGGPPSESVQAMLALASMVGSMKKCLADFTLVLTAGIISGQVG